MEIYSILSKILSESLLSLYPVFVKKINLPLDIQIITRLITYVMISLFFINYSFIINNLLTFDSLILTFINYIHIYSSYEGFSILDSGESFTIFYTYPLLILIFSGSLWKSAYIYAVFGLIIFLYSHILSNNNNNFDKKTLIYGYSMMIISAITEALIYFCVKRIKTDNSWNHVFISYFLSSIFYTFYIYNKAKETEIVYNIDNNIIYLALLINGIIGSLGYFLRFYSIYRLNPVIYSVLSFTGIIMAYLYGYLFNNEQIDIYKIIGTCLIIYSNYLILL